MLCLVPLVLGMGQLLAVRGSLRVKPCWLGPPPSTGVLLLFLRFSLWPLSRTFWEEPDMSVGMAEVLGSNTIPPGED